MLLSWYLHKLPHVLFDCIWHCWPVQKIKWCHLTISCYNAQKGSQLWCFRTNRLSLHVDGDKYSFTIRHVQHEAALSRASNPPLCLMCGLLRPMLLVVAPREAQGQWDFRKRDCSVPLHMHSFSPASIHMWHTWSSHIKHQQGWRVIETNIIIIKKYINCSLIYNYTYKFCHF